MQHQQNASRGTGALTAQYDFCPSTPEGGMLFSVRAGIPLSSAFDQLSLLLSSSIASVESLAAMGEKDPDSIPGALWQSVHLMNFAYALVQSMHDGHNATKTSDLENTVFLSQGNGGDST